MWAKQCQYLSTHHLEYCDNDSCLHVNEHLKQNKKQNKKTWGISLFKCFSVCLLFSILVCFLFHNCKVTLGLWKVLYKLNIFYDYYFYYYVLFLLLYTTMWCRSHQVTFTGPYFNYGSKLNQSINPQQTK